MTPHSPADPTASATMADHTDVVESTARVADTRHVARTATVVLGWGFQIGFGMLAIGLILSAVEGEPLAATVPPPTEVFENLTELQPAGFIDTAILWMIAVPVLAALAIAMAFLQLREWLYATLTLLVLAILAFSIGLAVA